MKKDMIFANKIAAKATKLLPIIFGNKKVIAFEHFKTNKKLIAFSIEGSFHPVVFLEDIVLGAGYDVDDMAIRLVNSLLETLKLSFSPKVSTQKNIIPFIINTKANEEFLETCPHDNFLDLSIVYKVFCFEDSLSQSSGFIPITYKNLDTLGLKREDLLGIAMSNVNANNPITVNPLDFVISKTFGISEDDVKSRGGKSCYLMTTRNGTNGAIGIMHTEKLFELSEKLNSNLYILPSSVHEILVLSVKGNELKSLSNLVKEVNKGYVLENEWLSDQVYKFNRDTKTVSIATIEEKNVNKK